MSADRTPAGLYVHVPFCEVKCTYCDFLSAPGGQDAQEAYLGLLAREATRWHASGAIEARTVFVGGGTPSMLGPGRTRRLLCDVVGPFARVGPVEWTFEANPESLTAELCDVLLAGGVDRLSMGVQSLDAAELDFLGRIHTADRAVKAFRGARAAGFANINVDLIFGFPGHTADSWGRTLDGVLGLGPEHISAYAFILEEGTRLWHEHRQGRMGEPDPDLAADLYAMARERLACEGLVQYEVSNFARPGRECAHNVGYWENRPYLGLGLGAVSFLDGTRRQNATTHAAYRRQVEEGRSHASAEPALGPDERVRESLILGLRMTRGVDPAAVCGGPLGPREMEEIVRVLDKWVDRGLLTRRGRLYAPAPDGIFLLNEVLVDLV